jgi:hypothetical protein
MTIATKITMETLDSIPDMILMRGNEDAPADAVRAFILYFQETFPDADVYVGEYWSAGMFAQAMYETDSTVMDLDPIIYSAINFDDVAYDLLIDDFVKIEYHDKTYYFRSTW